MKKYEDILIDLPLVNQKTDTKDSKWARKSCGICSLKMVLAWNSVKTTELPVMKLVKEAIALDGYINDIGWKHKVIVALAGRHGLKMGFAKKFFVTKSQKEKGLALLNKKLKARKPVLISIFHEFNIKNGGHIVVVNGLRKNGNKVVGYFIQDPHPEFKGYNYFVSKKRLTDNWRGGLIFPV